MVKAKGKKRSSKTGSKYRDKIVVAAFTGLLLIGIVAIVIASISASKNASTSEKEGSLDAAATSSASNNDSQSGPQAATDDGSDTVSPPALELLAQPTGELQIIDAKKGEGSPAANGNTLEVHYSGYLEDGTVFDSSLYHDQSYSFTLGSGRVIQGWEQGLAGMQPGGIRQLIIPPDLGYGANDYKNIPGGSTLIFNVELISIS